MRNLWIAVVVVGALAGCGTVHRSETVSDKPAVMDARLKADRNLCVQQAIGQADSKPVPTWGQTINREAYEDCMRRLGYDVDSAAASPR
jgi:uncharacterized protein YceK